MHRVANHSAWLFLMVPNSAWSCLMLPDRAMDNKAQPGTTKHHEAQSPGGSWETGPRPRVAVAPRPGGRQLGFPVLSAIVLAVALFWSLLAAPIARADPIADDIANELACQCGCGYTVASCGGAMQCDVGDQMAVLVSQKVKKGETKEEREEETPNYYRQERHYGAVQRSLTLPVRVDADKADATFENGVLSLRLPKAPEVRPKTIELKAKGVIEGKTW